MKKITIVGCGGMGINLATKFMRDRLFTEYDVMLLDTSKSNLLKEEYGDNVYTFEGLDGSGKLRSSNSSIIKERSREILSKIKMNELIVLVTSASGGSGNVIASVLLNELLEKDKNVIIACVGSSDSRIECENTIKTLKSFEIISNKHKKVVAVMYEENNEENSRGDVDAKMDINLDLLSLFFNGENKELDSSDLRNFINYNKVSDVEARLTFLGFMDKDTKLEKNTNVISCVTLTNEKISSKFMTDVEYQAVGFIVNEQLNMDEIKLPVHMVTVINYFSIITDKLEKKLNDFNEKRKAVVHKKIVNSDIKADDSGLVF